MAQSNTIGDFIEKYDKDGVLAAVILDTLKLKKEQEVDALAAMDDKLEEIGKLFIQIVSTLSMF